MQMRCCWPSEKPRALAVQVVFDLVPQHGIPQALLHDFIQLSLVLDQPKHAWAKGHVIVNRLRKWIRFLEHHPHPLAQFGHIVIGGIDIPAFQQDLPLDARPGDGVIHPVQAAQESGFAAARRSDQGRDLARQECPC